MMLSFSRSIQKEKGHHPAWIFFKKNWVIGLLKLKLIASIPNTRILVF
jgi:hypothetical protein